VIKTRGLGTYRGEKKYTVNLVRRPERKNHVKNLEVVGRIILNCILQKQNGKIGLD
jgi:hypothetical protein